VCVGGIPRGNPRVEVAVVLLDVPVDVLCEEVGDELVQRSVGADLSERRREERHEEQRTTDEHRQLGGAQQVSRAGADSRSDTQPLHCTNTPPSQTSIVSSVELSR